MPITYICIEFWNQRGQTFQMQGLISFYDSSFCFKDPGEPWILFSPSTTLFVSFSLLFVPFSLETNLRQGYSATVGQTLTGRIEFWREDYDIHPSTLTPMQNPVDDPVHPLPTNGESQVLVDIVPLTLLNMLVVFLIGKETLDLSGKILRLITQSVGMIIVITDPFCTDRGGDHGFTQDEGLEDLNFYTTSNPQRGNTYPIARQLLVLILQEPHESDRLVLLQFLSNDRRTASDEEYLYILHRASEMGIDFFQEVENRIEIVESIKTTDKIQGILQTCRTMKSRIEMIALDKR